MNPNLAEVQIPRRRVARAARDDDNPAETRKRCLRRGVVEHRVHAGGLREPIDERDQRDLHPHPSGRQPVAPLLSYGPSVMRRRRDVTAGAPSSGSRVRLCSLHHVTPADDAPRIAIVACFFPDHRLSNSGAISVGAPGTDRHACRCIAFHRWWDAERPTWLLAQVGRVEPLRSDVESMRYGASPRNPDPAPLSPVSSDRKPRSPVLLQFASVVACFRSLGCAIGMPCSAPVTSADVRMPDPNAPMGARQLAASRYWPACRGRAMGSRVCAVMGSGCTSES